MPHTANFLKIIVTSIAGPAENPCISCGACCAHLRVSFYCGELTGAAGGYVPAELVHQLTPLIVCMRGTEHGNQRCVALVGELGKPGIHCTIYPNRSSTCRDFPSWEEDGSPAEACQRLRAKIGLPALQPLRPIAPDVPFDHPEAA